MTRPGSSKINSSSGQKNTIDLVRKNKKVKLRDGLRQTVGIYYKDNQGDFVILASAVDKSTHARIGKLRTSMIFTFVFIVIGILLSSRWVAQKILKPLNKFIVEVKQVKANNLSFRVNEGNVKDEIGLLAQNFNQLMDHLEQAFYLQKTFVANVSHELRTPITSLLMEAEIALAQERSAANYQKALHSMVEDIDKMNETINSLVNLAQADLELGNLHTEPIDIIEMMQELQVFWSRKQQVSAQLHLKVDHTAKGLSIDFNKSLLEIALNNMIGNAFKFSNHKDVFVEIAVKDKLLTLSIEDMGGGISSSDAAFIYQPFYTSASRPETGKGLGLYMAYKIIGLSKGEVSFTATENGTIFYISWAI